jgi:hypothetical protein
MPDTGMLITKPMTNESETGRTWLLIGLGFSVFGSFTWPFWVRGAGRGGNSGMSQPAEFDWTLLDLRTSPYGFPGSRASRCSSTSGRRGAPCVQEMPSIPGWTVRGSGTRHRVRLRLD